MKKRAGYFRIGFSIVSIIAVLGSIFAIPAPVQAEIFPEVIGSFNTPGGEVQGMAWGNNNLWLADETHIYRLNASGVVQATFTAPVSSISDLAWYEDSLWVYGWEAERGTGVHKLNASMQITETLNVDEWMQHGFEWVGGYLYITNYNSGTIAKYNRAGTRLGDFDLASYFHPVGMASDSSTLWIGNSDIGPIYRYSTSGDLLDFSDFSSIDPTCNYNNNVDLAWDGQYLWYSCKNMVYHVDVTGPFVVANVSLPAVTKSEAAWGDYDGDSDLDVVLTGLVGSTPITKIYRNNGANSFVDTNASLAGVYNGSVDWGDFDHDGDLDIMLTGCADDSCSARTFRIYRNNGGTFTNVAGTGLPGVASSDADWGDYDNDGDLDILMVGHNGSAGLNRIFRNNGTGAFTPFELLDHYYGPIAFQLYNGAVAWGDYDNDGDLDALLTGCYTATCYQTALDIYENIGRDRFKLAFEGQGARDSSVAWGDYDNDGDLDILLAGSMGWAASEVCKTIIYENANAEAFNDIGALITGSCRGSAVWGDYDNDGDLDIGITGESSPSGYDAVFTKVYSNDGSGEFSDVQASMYEALEGSLAWGDAEKDGDLDILVTGSGFAGIYLNGTTTANTAPSAPGGLSVSFPLPGYVEFSWNRGTDTQTPAEGLSYNIRLGTTSGGSEVIAPMSVSDTGYRLVPKLGNAGASLKYRLSGLVSGQTYYWSVQSVDAAFTGSPFAASASFVMPPVYHSYMPGVLK